MMCSHQDPERENCRELLKTIGYVVSLKKHYFRVRDIINLLGMQPTLGRHRLSYSVKSLANRNLIQIYHRNSCNLYHIAARSKLLDAYYESLWSHFQTSRGSA